MTDTLYQPFPLPGRARAHIWRYTPDKRRPRHFHAELELNLIASGSGVFGVGSAAIDVRAGDLLWWSPGQDHELLAASPDLDLFVIGLGPEFSQRALGVHASRAHTGPVRVRVQVDALAMLTAHCAAPLSLQNSTSTETHVANLWQHAHALRFAAPSPMHTLTGRALTSLVAAPHLDRAELAGRTRGHPTEVSRYFRKDMGMSLTAYRTRLRLLRFVAAVDDGAETLLSAALHAGFGSYSQCHRVFQHAFGCTPRAFFATSIRQSMGNEFAPWPTPVKPTSAFGSRERTGSRATCHGFSALPPSTTTSRKARPYEEDRAKLGTHPLRNRLPRALR